MYRSYCTVQINGLQSGSPKGWHSLWVVNRYITAQVDHQVHATENGINKEISNDLIYADIPLIYKISQQLVIIDTIYELIF